MQAKHSGNLGTIESILPGWAKFETKLQEFFKNVILELCSEVRSTQEVPYAAAS